MAYLYLQRLVVVFLFLLLTSSKLTFGSPVYDSLYLSLTELQNINSTGLKVAIKSTLTLYCPNTTVQVYNVDKAQYDNCQPLTISNIQIGHCFNTPLSLNVQSAPIPGSVSYQIGETYYYAIYDSNKGTGPCKAGYKFMINIYDPDAIISTTPIPEPSSTTLIEPSSSTLIIETTTFSNNRLTTHLPPLRPTTTSTDRPTEPHKPTEKPTEPTESPKDNPPTDPRLKLSIVGPFQTIVPTLYGFRNGAQTLRISTMLFICTALAVMLILPLRRLL